MSKRFAITVLIVVFALPIGWERICSWMRPSFPRPRVIDQPKPVHRSMLSGLTSGRAESPEVDDSFREVVGSVAGKLERNSNDTNGNGRHTPVDGGTATRTQAEINEELGVYGIRSEAILGESIATEEARAALTRAVEEVARRFGDSVVVLDLDGDSMNGAGAVLYARDVYDMTDEVKDVFERIHEVGGGDEPPGDFEDFEAS